MTGDNPQPLPSGRHEDAVAALTGLVRALAEDESVRDTLQSILRLVLRAVPG